MDLSRYGVRFGTQGQTLVLETSEELTPAFVRLVEIYQP